MYCFHKPEFVYEKPAEKMAKINDAMKPAYWEKWNDGVQKKIDADIEKNRKADACLKLDSVLPGSEVKAEQISHDFVFGAHIFNFDQLGSEDCCRRYRDLYGALFNSATIAFYWKTLEQEEGKPRFQGEFRDTPEYWAKVKEPKYEPHWRRPAADPVVEYCLSRGIRLHGHPLTWGNTKWHYPDWLVKKLPEKYRKDMKFPMDNPSGRELGSFFENFTEDEIEKIIPEYLKTFQDKMASRIMEIAMRYKGKINSWDVCNESAVDFERGSMKPGSAVTKSAYGIMPGDYTYRSFKIADAVFPKDVKLNINDYYLKSCYTDQIADLIGRGCKIDVMGAQMHLFNPQTCTDIADGVSDEQSPARVWETMNMLSAANLPIHLSEITITAPNNDERGQALQAVIARNLYRLWFSIKNMMGITWWNVVDDCGAPGEPSVSGLFTRDMKPKPAYFALNDLIHDEWMTRASVTAEKDGTLCFRGFRGMYRITWKDAAGNDRSMLYHLQ